MLKLQRPHSMPFAVPLPQPLDCLTSQSKMEPSLPPLTSSHDLQRLPNNTRLHMLPAPSRSTNMSLAAEEHGYRHTRNGPLSYPNGDIQTYSNSSLQQTAGQASRAVSSIPSSPSQPSTHDSMHRRKTSSNAIATQLQIPKTISTPQNSLLQLAAETTCLFWFETSSTLQEILRSGSPRTNLKLCSEAIPTTGFKKWVAMILSTTQVAQNVILLALLFIYRLKKINPGVKGKSGSEFRLLTVALMLGNKFLDDNTYTNKTWAEVSGISVLEVHMMEVEFLQNMKYDLFTSEAEWRDWHIILGKFGTFFDRASRAQLEGPPRSLGPMTPTGHIPPSLGSLPPSPASHYASPPFASSGRFSPNRQPYSTTPLLLPQVASSTLSPIGPLPELDTRFDARKRVSEDPIVKPPPKRQIRQFTTSMTPTSASVMPLATAMPSLPRLPSLPSLSIPVSQNADPPAQLHPQLSLPGSRAMSLVFPPPVQWPQSSSTPLATTPGNSSSPISQPVIQLQDPSRQLSPFPPGSVGSSPVSASFPPGSSQNPGRLSPSHILSQRQSPYRPVRRVNTLLYPPPTTIMQNPPRPIAWDQMQYQQLGRSERRAGILPYMNRDAWPETNQLNQWPILPQPKFSRV